MGNPEWVKDGFRFGWTGVDLFFVLSGFLIASPLFASMSVEKPISLKAFFIKRFFRIIPPYLVIVAIYFLFPSFRERPAPAPLWKYLSFTQNLGLDLRTQGTFSHAWSLCIEEQFYLFLPLILVGLVSFRLVRKGLAVLLFFFGVCFLLRLFSWFALVEPHSETGNFGYEWYKWIYYPTYCRLDGLLVGVSIAAIFQFRPKWRDWLYRFGNYWLLAGLAILLMAYFLCEQQLTFESSIFGFPLVSLGYGFLVLGAVCPKSILYRFRSGIFAWIATLSYVIYLSHKMMIHLTKSALSKLGMEIDANWVLIMSTIVSLSCALLMHIVIERPFLKLRKMLLLRKTEKLKQA